MKKILTLCAALALAGCGTPTQNIAMAGAEAGNAIATYMLDTYGPGEIQALTDIAVDLPNVPLGKVSTAKQGFDQGELQRAQGTLTSPAGVKNQQLYDQFASALALFTNNQGSFSGGAETADMALLSQQGQNLALGIQNAINHYNGVQAGLKGGVAPP